MEIAPHVSVDPSLYHGIAVVSGSRVPVSIVLGSLADGMTRDEVAEEYGITPEEVDAALKYGADTFWLAGQDDL
jgi:uncharacterized protein (DUF433 family)